GFLNGAPHAVVGASRDRTKIGHRVLQVYMQQGRPVYAVNPYADKVAGLPAYPDLASLPQPIHGVSMIAPPEVAESVVEQAGVLGIKHIWFQPGAESPAAIARARQLGIDVISGGPCILVVLGYRDR
ncbi:MAG: CoA-binding protein, partial [Planctomycetota bacterium]